MSEWRIAPARDASARALLPLSGAMVLALAVGWPGSVLAQSEPPGPAALIEPGPLEWTDMRNAASLGKEALLADVATDSTGTSVMLGTRKGIFGGTRAWYSTDGQSWTAVDLPGGKRAFPASVAVTDRGFVAVGTDQSRPGRIAGQLIPDGLIWVSGSGAKWSKPARIKNASLSKAFGTSDGLVVVGVDTRKSGRRPTMWRSEDGSKWTRAQLKLPSIAVSSGLGAATSSNGTWLLSGELERKGDFVAKLWRSEDGSAWTEVTIPTTQPGVNAVVRGVASTPSGFILTTSQSAKGSQAPDGAVWWSEDGVDWLSLGGPSAQYLGPFTGPNGSVISAFGLADLTSGEEPGQSSILVSEDGSDWCLSSGPAPGATSASIRPDGQIVATSFSMDAKGRLKPFVWISEIAEGSAAKACDERRVLGSPALVD